MLKKTPWVRFALELGCAGQVQSISAAVHAAGHANIQVPVVFKNAAR
ncbi:MAG: hypothetical protein ABJB12_05750 [Pseudomonadota bacterium]